MVSKSHSRIVTGGKAGTIGDYAKLAAMLGVLLVPACAVQSSSTPMQTQATTPTVTYRYTGEPQLIQANRDAVGFCSQYQLAAKAQSVTDMVDGSKSAVFQCVPATVPMAVLVPVTPVAPTTVLLSPRVSYTYTTDAQVMQGSRSADAYCHANGGVRAISNVTQNVDGTRTLNFECAVQ